MEQLKARKPQKKHNEDKAQEIFAFIGIGTCMYLVLKAVQWAWWLVAYVFELAPFNG